MIKKFVKLKMQLRYLMDAAQTRSLLYRKDYFQEGDAVLKNQRGSSLIAVLGVTSALALSMYLISKLVLGYKQQTLQTEQMLNIRSAISSTMDFVIFGIKQRYCFSENLLNGSQCDLNNSGSVERLIMSKSRENLLKGEIENGTLHGVSDPSHLHLNVITRSFNFSQVSSVHPLFIVFQNEKLKKLVAGVWVKIERNNSAYLPRSGDETYLKITVELIGVNGKHPLEVGTKVARLVSSLVVYPREVGSFALLIPGDMHLDLPYNANLNAGNVSFHKFTNISSGQPMAGLNFLSPVYVNNNIYLPSPVSKVQRRTGGGVYTPVSFSGRVYTGTGLIYEGNHLYEPLTAGGLSDRYWSDNKLFGGFRKGIESDGTQDAGLTAFVSHGGVTVDSSLAKECIERTQMKTNRSHLATTTLSASSPSLRSDGTIRYTVALSGGDEFLQQRNSYSSPIAKDWGTGTYQLSPSSGRNSVGKIQVIYNGGTIESEMPVGGELKVIPQVGSLSLQSQLQSAVRQADTSLQTKQTQLAAMQTNLSNLQEQLSTLESSSESSSQSGSGSDASATDSSSESGSDSSTTDTSSTSSNEQQKEDLQNQISALEAQILSAQNIISQVTVEKTTAQSTLSAYQDKVNNPPEIKVTIDSLGKKEKSQLALDIQVKNATSMIDGHGQPALPTIGYKAYDLTYFRSEVISPPENARLQGYIHFNWNSDSTSLVPAQQLSSNSTASVPMGAYDSAESSSDIDDRCEEQRNSLSAQAFGMASENYSFTDETRYSWNFAGTESSTLGQDPLISEIIFDGSNAKRDLLNVSFQVRSIVGVCRIKASANFVAGFFGCDQLIIESRSTPLRIIGSFIVGRLEIAPTAYQAGIDWSTIYYPQATYELRAAGILRTLSGGSCNYLSEPIWHPLPSVQAVSDRIRCNAISLRAQADPFQWTTVDPDCGLLPGSSSNVCKRRPLRFFVIEQSRENYL